MSVAGKPRSALQMALPTAEQLKFIIDEGFADVAWTESDLKEFEPWKKLAADLDIDGYDLLRAYHQQVMVVTDDAGTWYAMKIKDKALNDALNQKINDHFGISPQKTEMEGVTIEHTHYSLVQKLYEVMPDSNKDDDEVSRILNLFKDHMYWYEADGVIYFAQIPQILVQKRNHKNSIMLSDWLASNQGSDWSAAALAYGKDVKDLPQNVYHFYLKALQAMADLSGGEANLFVLPTAEKLNLPDSGRLNLVLNVDAEKVSLRFGYEYSMIDPILGGEGGFTAIAMAGILAAYAIPAYRDYTIRAQVASELAYASSLKMIVAEAAAVHGGLTEAAMAEIQQSVDDMMSDYRVDPATGAIVIDLSHIDGLSYGHEMRLKPNFDYGYVEWDCVGNIKKQWMPSACSEMTEQPYYGE